MPSNHLVLCCPLLLMPSIFPSIRVFSNDSALRIRWPKYWSFSFTKMSCAWIVLKPSLPPPVRGKIVFHKTSPRCQKGCFHCHSVLPLLNSLRSLSSLRFLTRNWRNNLWYFPEKQTRNVEKLPCHLRNDYELRQNVAVEWKEKSWLLGYNEKDRICCKMLGFSHDVMR